jgi:hypothetical protein
MAKWLCEDQACLVGPEVNQHPHWYNDKNNPKIHANYYFKILKISDARTKSIMVSEFKSTIFWA